MQPVLPSHGCHIPFAPTLFDLCGMPGPEACGALRLAAPPAAVELPFPRKERFPASVSCTESQALQQSRNRIPKDDFPKGNQRIDHRGPSVDVWRLQADEIPRPELELNYPGLTLRKFRESSPQPFATLPGLALLGWCWTAVKCFWIFAAPTVQVRRESPPYCLALRLRHQGRVTRGELDEPSGPALRGVANTGNRLFPPIVGRPPTRGCPAPLSAA